MYYLFSKLFPPSLNDAVNKNDIVLLSTLVRAMPKPLNLTQIREQEKALLLAIEKGNIDIVKFLIGGSPLNIRDLQPDIIPYMSPIQINAMSHTDMTPLMVAAENGQVEIVQFLLDQQADINAVTREGWTALMFAANEGFAPVVQKLLDKSADPNLRNANGDTALEIARSKIYTEHFNPIIQLLETPPAPAPIRPRPESPH